MTVLVLGACAHGAPEAAGGAGPAESQPGVRVPLKYEMTDSRPPEGGPVSLRLRVWVEPFSDARPSDRETIGVNDVDGLPLSVRGMGPVADIVTDGFRQEFQRLFGPLAPTSENAARIVRGQVLKFWVSAGRTYRADVQLHVQVIDPVLGSAIFDRHVEGSDHTFGSVASPKNDAQVFVGAVRETVMTVLNDRAFLVALGGR